MYRKIMVPVDLRHAENLGKALRTAADLSKNYQAPICYVGVTSSAPSDIAHNPQEYAAKLDMFAQEQAAAHGIQASAKAITSHDPAADLTRSLAKAIEETGADLVVMATHAPNVSDYIWASHGGGVAAHAGVSVFLVR